jgi:hypothetical protein
MSKGVAVARGERSRGRVILTAMLAVLTAGPLAGCSPTPAPSGEGPTTGASATPDGEGALGGAVVNATPGVSVIVDRKELVLPDGRAFSLATVDGGAMSGYQTRDGWLVNGFGNGVDTLSLWLVLPDGTLRKMVDRAEAPVAVAPDGRRIAWRFDGKLYFGRVNPSATAVVDVTSPAPARGHPISLTNDTVVLGYSETGGGIDHHDLWYPALGAYKPTWDKSAHVRAVFGPTPDGVAFLGLVPNPSGPGHCIAELNAKDSLKATRTACGLPVQLRRYGTVTGDGKLLAVYSNGTSGTPQIGVVDLTTVFTTPTLTASWSATADGAWEDTKTMLVPSSELGGALVRYQVGSGTGTAADRPGVTGGMSVVTLPRLV